MSRSRDKLEKMVRLAEQRDYLREEVKSGVARLRASLAPSSLVDRATRNIADAIGDASDKVVEISRDAADIASEHARQRPGLIAAISAGVAALLIGKPVRERIAASRADDATDPDLPREAGPDQQIEEKDET